MARLNITFMDGSNTFLKYGDDKELRQELCRWMKNYDLRIMHAEGNYKVVARCIEGDPKKMRWTDGWKD